jgi:hypothetical protein
MLCEAEMSAVAGSRGALPAVSPKAFLRGRSSPSAEPSTCGEVRFSWRTVLVCGRGRFGAGWAGLNRENLRAGS